MIDLIKQWLPVQATADAKRQLIREYLQVAVLKILSDRGYSRHMAFQGGTALRLLYDLRRFSEDLDFSLTAKDGFRFAGMLDDISRSFADWGMPVEIKREREKTVAAAWIKFKGVLKSLGLSPLEAQALAVKIEIDQRPPQGYKTGISIISRQFMFPVVHFDRPSMFATKIHACFYRRFIKGRDMYDLLWYLGRNDIPNFALLNNAIRQTHGVSPGVGDKNLSDFLVGHVREYDFTKAAEDVRPFLMDQSELASFNRKLVEDLVMRRFER